MKNNCFLKPKRISKKAGFFFFFFCISANLSNVWLNREEVDSHICFSLSPTVIFHMSYTLWKSPLFYLQENESEKSKQHLDIIMKVVQHLHTF